MAKYKVKNGQNIFDVAIALYGSIEGLFDLLISNRGLSMDTQLTAGMELEYHDYFVMNQAILDEMKMNGYSPANGERQIYPKKVAQSQVFHVSIENSIESTAFCVSGAGSMLVDWGDNSNIETIALTNDKRRIEHYFDCIVDKRDVKIFGTFSITYLDISELNGQLYTYLPVSVEEFVSKSTDYKIDSLFLFDDTYKIDLSGMYIADLSPIYRMSLQELDLRRANMDAQVIDEYLQNIATNYGSRRNCMVYLSTMPTQIGMDAIQTIIGEPAWNEGGAWVFNINGTIYTVQ